MDAVVREDHVVMTAPGLNSSLCRQCFFSTICPRGTFIRPSETDENEEERVD